MDWIQQLALAGLQGFTEFLPISSSAHLQLPRILLGWEDQGLAFDVAVHAGTLLAVMLYFRSSLWRLGYAWSASLGGRHSHDSRLAWMLMLATGPVVVAGLLLEGLIAGPLRQAPAIAANTVIFALLLWFADRYGSRRLRLSELSWPIALAIGCAQVLALAPGVSRSGIVISAALALGLRRGDATRFTLLLAVPVIAGAALLQSLRIGSTWSVELAVQLIPAAAVAALVAFATIGLFLRWVERIGMFPFVVYRLMLGLALLILLWL